MSFLKAENEFKIRSSESNLAYFILETSYTVLCDSGIWILMANFETEYQRIIIYLSQPEFFVVKRCFSCFLEEVNFVI